jgi:hypothetical protein
MRTPPARRQRLKRRHRAVRLREFRLEWAPPVRRDQSLRAVPARSLPEARSRARPRERSHVLLCRDRIAHRSSCHLRRPAAWRSVNRETIIHECLRRGVLSPRTRWTRPPRTTGATAQPMRARKTGPTTTGKWKAFLAGFTKRAASSSPQYAAYRAYRRRRSQSHNFESRLIATPRTANPTELAVRQTFRPRASGKSCLKV